MPLYENRFQVRASPEAVSLFHKDTSALTRLTPPPIFVQIHSIEPLAEGSQSEFTLWFGPLPVRWLAVHSMVDPIHGFTDTQARGPMKRWVHTHSWNAVDAYATEMIEHVDYEHFAGLPGFFTRLLFAPPLLGLMFTYRKWIIKRALERPEESAR